MKNLFKRLRTGLLPVLAFLCGWSVPAQVATVPVSGLPTNARLALCGDSITEQMLYTKYVEIYLLACAGRKDVSVFQFGWGGENADQFSNRINRGDLDAFVPTAVTFLYGANDGAGQAWQSWMETMWNGRVTNILTNLNNKYPSAAAYTVICGPTYFDLNSDNSNAAGVAVSNDTLGHFRNLNVTLAQTNSRGLADIRQRMYEAGTAAKTALGSSYHFGGNDGVHAGPNGHLMMAYEILKAFNCDGAIATITVNQATGAATASTGHTIVSSAGGAVTVDSARYPFCYHYDNSTAADRMSTILPYLPFSANLNRFMLVATNLGAGSANVTWGGVTQTFTSAELAAGVNLADKFATTPFDSTFANVMALIATQQAKERDMIKAAGDATAPAKGWTDADVAARNTLETNVKNAITTVRHTITIAPVGGAAAPVISGATSATGTVGAAFSYQIVAANTPTSYNATNLPAGLSVNASTGLISGTPTAAGTRAVTLSATNAAGTGTATLSLTINAAAAVPVITSATTASGTVGTAFNYQIAATNTPTKYYATGLPGGLSVNAATGLISGTPIAAGTTGVLISAENAGGNGAAVTLNITIATSTGGGTGGTIISDAFVWNESAGQTGWATSYFPSLVHAPDTNLPGGTWQLDNSANDVYGIGIRWDDVLVVSHEGGSAGISLTSSGSYAKPANLHMATELRWEGTPGDTAGAYALVGFYSALNGTTGYNTANTLSGFTGLKLSYASGSLQLIVNGAAAGSAVAYTGTWTPTTARAIAYDINTASGSIANVTLGGSSSSYSFSTSAFTNAATAWAGLGGYCGNSGVILMDNLAVSGSATGGATIYALTVANGTGGGSYAATTTVAITANAAPSGQAFSQWTGDTDHLASATAVSTTIVMPAHAVTVTATYATTSTGGGTGGTIISDAFVWNESAGQTGWATSYFPSLVHAPDTNLPGGTWQLDNSANDVYGIGIRWDDVLVVSHEGGSAGISLTSSGSYAKPANLHIATELKWEGTPGDTAGAYALVGFYSALNGTTGYNTANTLSGFTGLKLSYASGSLQLIVNGAAAGSAGAYTGTWTPTAVHALAYDINTSSGTIANVTLGGSSSSYSFSTSAFTNAATAWAGLGGYCGNSGVILMDNLAVSGSATGGATIYALTVANGTGGGSYAATTTVAIAANAAPTGQTFSQWTGDTDHLASPTAASTTVVMPTHTVTVTATYATTSTGGSGTSGTIISDAFVWNEDAGQTGWATSYFPSLVHAPDTNLPGGTWQLDNSANDVYGIGIRWDDVLVVSHEGGSAGISLTSSGSYAKPASLHIATELKWEGTPGDTVGAYALVGFYSALNGTTGYNTANTLSGFTGLKLSYANGSLQLIVNGAAAGSAVAYTGAWTPTTARAIAYDINTASGSIANVTLGGSSSSYLFSTSAFTNAATAWAGLGGYCGNSGVILMDNLVVSGSDSSGGTGGGVSPFAVASGGEWGGAYPQFNPLLHQAGVKYLRLFGEMAGIEPQLGVWDFSVPDAIVANAAANGITITGGLWFFAPWASSADASETDWGKKTRTFPVKNIQYWRDYTGTLVNRYKDSIKEWEVWNEVDTTTFATNGTPANYAAIVAASYEAGKAVDPTAKFGLSVANFDVNYLDQTIKAGAANKFDFICVHPYENLAAVAQGGESSFLSLAGTLRTMLAANNQPTTIPLWMSEVGVQSTTTADAAADATQAQLLVKAYVLGMAQGFERIFWFEARGPSYGNNTDYGLIRSDWTLRPSHTAYQVMTTHLGATPQYRGWLQLNTTGYGFVFQGASTPVLAAWMPPAATSTVTFSAATRVATLTGGVANLAANTPLVLTNTPVFVLDLPAALVTQAAAQKAQPFPWGGDYSQAQQVSCLLGPANVDGGITQINQATTVADTAYPGEPCRRLDFTAAYGEGRYAYFRVDSGFASYGTSNVTVTAVVRSLDTTKPAGTDITYESSSGYKEKGYQSIPADDQWHELSWTVTDANFVGAWGWNFRLNALASPNEFWVKEVRVHKN